jgi:dihydrofolate reductase
MHNDPRDGETGINDDILREVFENIGAIVMGRNMFGGGPGPWPEEPWNGWWGDNPPFHVDVFVLTHYPRESLSMNGGTTFHFVTDDIDSALRQARDAADGKDIVIGGGANAVQQYLAAGLLDEMDVHIVPQILGGGARLFDNVGTDVKLELLRTVEGPGVTHLRYWINKA